MSEATTISVVQVRAVPWRHEAAELRRLAAAFRDALPEGRRNHSEILAMMAAAAATHPDNPDAIERQVLATVAEYADTALLCDLADAMLEIVSADLIPTRLSRTHIDVRRAS